MAEYQVLKQDKKLGIYATHEMDCATDNDALTEAIELAHDCPAFELWAGARRVACVVNLPDRATLQAVLKRECPDLAATAA